MTQKQRPWRRQLWWGTLIAVISFTAGMRSDVIAQAIAPVFGLRVATGAVETAQLQEVYRQLKAHYDGELRGDALAYGAIKGMVAAAGDPHTVFYDPTEAEELDCNIRGNVCGGIGVELGFRRSHPTILQVISRSPAEQAGMQRGDVIVKVNDESVDGLSLGEVTERITGPIDTSVTVEVQRDTAPQRFTLRRQTVAVPAVEWRLDQGVGIMRVRTFNDETGTVARRAAEEFRAAGVRRVIVDLRGNPGGTVPAAQALAGLWLEKQPLLTQRRGGVVVSTEYTTGTPLLGDVNTVILVNGGSASASEIVAGALREYGKAILVGEKTYGKGSVQQLITLDNNTMLKVTESRWFTPKGVNIDAAGLQPDTEIKLTAQDADSDHDPQLQYAMKP